MRFVAVGTMMRGALAAVEPLDDIGQALAAARMAQDVGSERHARGLLSRDRFPPPRRDHMSVTADEVAWARRIIAQVEARA